MVYAQLLLTKDRKFLNGLVMEITDKLHEVELF